MSAKELRELKEARLERLKWDRYRRDPLFWLVDRFGEDSTSFEWSKLDGYDNHTWDGDKDPLAEAWRTLGEGFWSVKNGQLPEYRYVGIEAATGTSKTYWLARLVFWYLDCFENSLVVTTAPKQDQLKLGLWSEIGMIATKVRKLRPESNLYKLRLALDETDTKDLGPDEINTSNSWHAIGFVAGTGADEQSADRARGFHRKNMLIVLEECTGIPMPVMTAFQNTSTGLTNFIVAVGNPNNEFDPLHQFCSQKDVKSFRISAMDYPNIVRNNETFSGAVTWASIRSRADVYGEGSPLYNAMVRGISPAQASDSLIKIEWVEQCIKKDDEEFKYGKGKVGSYNAVGVDVANSEAGDKAALAWGVDAILKQVEEFYCNNATHLAYNLYLDDAELDRKGYNNYRTGKMYDYGIEGNCVGIDAVGVGVATVNAFLDEGYIEVQALSGGEWSEVIPKEEVRHEGRVQEKPMYRFSGLRSQMYWELREDLRKKHIQIQVTNPQMLTQIKKELCIIKFEANSSSIEVEKKENIKKRLGGKSPNVADAIAYWNWTRKGYRINTDFFAAISAGD